MSITLECKGGATFIGTESVIGKPSSNSDLVNDIQFCIYTLGEFIYLFCLNVKIMNAAKSVCL